MINDPFLSVSLIKYIPLYDYPLNDLIQKNQQKIAFMTFLN